MRLYTAGMMDNPSAHVDDILPNTRTESSSDEDMESLASIIINRPVLSSLQISVEENRMRRLHELCPQNWRSNNHGIDIFLTAKQILSE
ncbi:hypothetical protein DPMN_109286 [Dreissena polymorpha]|uniref:Uncharacterized protein n=1 Tax=Dreissena polymorpha TaxID=45954 RepID=A0A9D4KAQ9_DREPO|nr:hypothetical protein DPMN_109286 [Dreissena polymorpha]